MKVSKEAFANLDRDALIDILFSLDGTICSMQKNNLRLIECFSSATEVADAQALVGNWTAANALAIQSSQDVLIAAFADAAKKLN